jgi:hypothetical protein
MRPFTSTLSILQATPSAATTDSSSVSRRLESSDASPELPALPIPSPASSANSESSAAVATASVLTLVSVTASSPVHESPFAILAPPSSAMSSPSSMTTVSPSPVAAALLPTKLSSTDTFYSSSLNVPSPTQVENLPTTSRLPHKKLVATTSPALPSGSQSTPSQSQASPSGAEEPEPKETAPSQEEIDKVRKVKEDAETDRIRLIMGKVAIALFVIIAFLIPAIWGLKVWYWRRRKARLEGESNKLIDVEKHSSPGAAEPSSPAHASLEMKEKQLLSPVEPALLAPERTYEQAPAFPRTSNSLITISTIRSASTTASAALSRANTELELLPSPSASVKRVRHAQAVAAFCRGVPSRVAWRTSAKAENC